MEITSNKQPREIVVPVVDSTGV